MKNLESLSWLWGRGKVRKRLVRWAVVELCKALNARPGTLNLPLGRISIRV